MFKWKQKTGVGHIKLAYRLWTSVIVAAVLAKQGNSLIIQVFGVCRMLACITGAMFSQPEMS